MRRPPRSPKPANETCPHCGATFRRGRLACPECGSDAATGWRSSEDVDYESVELPEPEGDGSEAAARPRDRILTALVVLLVLVLAVVMALW